MIAFATLSGPLPKVGVIAVAALAAWVMLAREPRSRAWAMLGALVVSPILLLADIWHSPQLHIVHHHSLVAAIGGAVAVAVLCGVAAVLVPRSAWLGPLAVFAVPFRVPIQVGDTTSNLLVPLYLVVAAGTLAAIARAFIAARGAGSPELRRAGWLERLLALYVVVYAIQAVYSPSFEKALQQVVFFYVPFALLMTLLRELHWDRELLKRCLLVVAGLAVVFAGIGFVEYATKTLLLNPKLVAANGVHTYFSVNSVFFDPDIFGRFLALVMVLLAALLLYDVRPRVQISVTVVLAILWGGLVLTLSRSSLGALLVGLATLAAMRWRARPVLIVGAVVIACGASAVAITPKTFGLNQGVNGASSGRANLVSGGLRLFGNRPAFGYGSGSFVTEYRRHNKLVGTTLSASHTIPITIAAEQGIVGELVYVALVLVAIIGLFRGAKGDPPSLAIAAAFLALVLHTMLYADFLEDPVTWTLLGIGAALAGARAPRPEAQTRPRRLARA